MTLSFGSDYLNPALIKLYFCQYILLRQVIQELSLSTISLHIGSATFFSGNVLMNTCMKVTGHVVPSTAEPVSEFSMTGVPDIPGNRWN